MARHFKVSAGAVVMALSLAACDQVEERQSRANQLLDAVIDQLEASETSGGLSALELATPEDRAVAGVLSAAANRDINTGPQRFAVGSIIAKPLIVDRMQRAVRAQAPTPGIAERRAPASRSVQRVPAANDKTAAAAPPPDNFNEPELDGLTEDNLEPRLQEAMRAARSDAYARMDALGLEGTVVPAANGNLVIDMFASASQFSGEDANQPYIVEEADIDCPETLEPTALGEDKVFATACMVELLQASGDYEYVEKDYIFDHQFARRPRNEPGTFALTPDDTLWTLQWHFGANGSEAGAMPGAAGFVDFWTREQTTGSDKVTVAIVDTGLALAHPDIAGSPNLAPGWDMVTDPAMSNDNDSRDNDPTDPGDLCNPDIPGAADSFHGSHVAGTVGAAATNNSTGVAGGAWAVRIVPVRALGKCGGRLSDINDSILWAAGIIPAESAGGAPIFNQNPADIINLSIGVAGPCPASMQDAINTAVDRGALIVAAAGNAGQATEFFAPASCDNVITVAAGDARGHIAPYSNFGPEVDVLAPGGDLARDDNQDGHPDGVLSARPAADCRDPVTGDPIAICNYAFEQGTSMAAPHVSAALALISAKNPELTGPQLEAVLSTHLMPRDDDQCTASCTDYPDATEIPGRPGVCLRTCGGLLNLGYPAPDPSGEQ